MPLFDMRVSLSPWNTPPGLAPADAIKRVQQALGMEVGLGQITVVWEENNAAIPTIEIFESTSGISLDEGARERLAALMLRQLQKALFTGPRAA